MTVRWLRIDIKGTALTASASPYRKGIYRVKRASGEEIAIIFRKPGKQSWMLVLPHTRGTMDEQLQYPSQWHGPYPTLQKAGRMVWAQWLKGTRERKL